MNKIAGFLLFFLAATSCAWAKKPVANASKPVEVAQQLACGSARLEVLTKLHKHSTSTQVISQRLSLQGAKNPLPTEAPPQAQLTKAKDTLPVFLSGWACLTNEQRQAFFYLAYYCSQESACGENKEWARLLTLDGKVLNTKPMDLEEVMKSQGLARYLQEGVELADPLEP